MASVTQAHGGTTSLGFPTWDTWGRTRGFHFSFLPSGSGLWHSMSCLFPLRSPELRQKPHRAGSIYCPLCGGLRPGLRRSPDTPKHHQARVHQDLPFILVTLWSSFSRPPSPWKRVLGKRGGRPTAGEGGVSESFLCWGPGLVAVRGCVGCAEPHISITGTEWPQLLGAQATRDAAFPRELPWPNRDSVV